MRNILNLAINGVLATMAVACTYIISLAGGDAARVFGPQILLSLIENNLDAKFDLYVTERTLPTYAEALGRLSNRERITVHVLTDLTSEEFASIQQTEDGSLLFVDVGAEADVFELHQYFSHHRKYGQVIAIVSPEGLMDNAITVTPFQQHNRYWLV